MKTSAGLLMYRVREAELQVLLAHPGGPYFRNKDEGAWTIPKGELGEGEAPEACAVREFREETGIDAAGSELCPLGEIKQRGGKRVLAWAVSARTDLVLIDPPPSNTFELEWPPRSGKRASFPEIDRLVFFALPVARQKILTAQAELLDRLQVALDTQIDK
ncbi:MAG: hydrolase [Myxococcaceae bacterium]|nr:hydrolase [Myxococcaceae bacterium]